MDGAGFSASLSDCSLLVCWLPGDRNVELTAPHEDPVLFVKLQASTVYSRYIRVNEDLKCLPPSGGAGLRPPR